MSTPYEPPAGDMARPPLDRPTEDPHLVITAVLLLLYGAPMVGLAVLFPPVGVIGGFVDPEMADVPAAPLLMGGIGCIEGLCIGLFGALYVAAAAGLFGGRKWGWVVALISIALWLTSPCCLPFGAYALFALLRENVRRLYGWA